MSFLLRISLVGLLCLSCVACARSQQGKNDLPRLLPRSWQISVAPFTQPLNPAQLLTGSIPEDQGKVPEQVLSELNDDLRQLLQKETERSWIFIPEQQLPENWHSGKSTGQPSALSRWLAYGKAHNAKYLLVPQVLDWHEREGSEAGVTQSAHARVEFFLLDTSRDLTLNRSVYEEKQVGLVDNLLTMGNFLRRRGQWVTASDLAMDGMRQAIRELGL